MKTTTIALITTLLIMHPNGQEKQLRITDFTDDTNLEWFIVNDGVMGGLSESTMKTGRHGHGIFSGNVSLKNNGGFASVRAVVPEANYSGYKQIAMKVKGDGKKYQFRIRTDKNFDGVTYRAAFTATGEWQEVVFSEDDFTPVFRGRVIRDYPALDFGKINQIGFLIADKQVGNFALMVDEIEMK